MKKYIALLSLLGLLATTKAQVSVQVKNTTDIPLVVENLSFEVKDTIAAHGVGKLRQFPAIHSNQELMITANKFTDHVNNNRGRIDTTYKSGVFSLYLIYNPTKKRWHSWLKKI